MTSLTSALVEADTTRIMNSTVTGCRSECSAEANRISANTPSFVRLIQRVPFVHRDVVGLAAFDFVLRLILAGTMHVPLIINIPCVHLDDLPAHPPRLP